MSVMPNLISISDLNRKQIEQIIDLAEELKRFPDPNYLSGKIIASLFFEASTRTRLSFESAIYRLGGKIIGFADSKNTSLDKKGESLEDTILMINGYADLIVMRHPVVGSAKLASEFASIPVINAGDGSNEHPTQTLLDLYTIKEHHGQIDHLHIGLVGDLKYGRTIHSLIKALSLFESVTLYLVAEDSFDLPEELHQEATKHGVNLIPCNSLKEMLPKVDVLYMTRIQKERLADKVDSELQHVLTKALVEEYAKDTLIVLHPLPRQEELCASVDQLKQAKYIHQAHNGLYVRQAILKLLLRDIV
ncbi:aspartate carbamoyltransferase [Thiotrichales bacterium 19S9-12]|nr:aspartate carbamoyltransferase [Thiotrichales bacterium 19S9-11]MCF6811936.1 aspartate carbamoyltransferase [Thiotrichales bacterium 19S9-12]